jgi:hypothetical protein
VSDNASRTGITFALTPPMQDAPPGTDARIATIRPPPPAFFAGSSEDAAGFDPRATAPSGPRLELYVK